MNNMQQRIYRPPNVAGWEGGMSWLNTNTVQGRFDLVRVAQYLRYSNFYATRRPRPRRRASTTRPTWSGRRRRPRSSAPTPRSASRGSRARPRDELLAYAATLTEANRTGTAAANITARRQRFYALQAMILGGPDGQVM